MMGTDSAIGDAKLTRFAELIEQRLGLQYSRSSLIELEAIPDGADARTAMPQLRCVP